MATAPLQQECWLEMDLYWFQGAPPQEKASELFDRLTPLWQRSPQGRKGLALCVGWLFDAVLEFDGELDATIPTCQQPKYEPWTYRRLKALAEALRDEAQRRKLDPFHIGLILLASATMSYPESAFEGWSGRTEEQHEKAGYNIEGYWFRNHPEVGSPDYHLFDWRARVALPGDQTCAEGVAPTFGEYFAAKLGALAAATGLGAVVLRDGVFTPSYVRGGATRFKSPQAADHWNAGLIECLRSLRQHAPHMVILGYDSGTSAMEEWRSHGFDLERVARAGVLDLWITQTWASAWQDYWPAHAMGYTFQLARVLTNLAMLAPTPCRHLFLVETFDAWEPWDSIHQFPAKVAWEIWAYSHASVLMPDGVAGHSAGYYSSWMNRGRDLLPQATVDWLVGQLDACATDLARQPLPGGPCIVHHRAGLEWLLAHPAEHCRGEGYDDWIAMLLKYGLPCLSITRSEWLGQGGIAADSWIWPAPAQLTDHLQSWLLTRLQQGEPVLLLGQAALLPDALRAALGVQLAAQPVTAELPDAAELENELASWVGTRAVVINQRQRTLAVAPAWQSLLTWHGGPVFAGHRQLPCFIWETPEWGTPMELHLSWRSVESPQTYAAIAHALQAFQGALRFEIGHLARPVCYLEWHGEGADEYTILLGNLETGVLGNSQFCVKGQLRLASRDPLAITPHAALWSNQVTGKYAHGETQTAITLGAHKSALFRIQRNTTGMVARG
jgi:hypothetical protein